MKNLNAMFFRENIAFMFKFKLHETIFKYFERVCPLTRPKFAYMEISIKWSLNYFEDLS